MTIFPVVIGMCSAYLHGHCHHFVPLYASLNGKPKDIECRPLQEPGFYNARIALSTVAALTFTELHAPLLLSTDSSDVTKGCCWISLPLNFFRRKLSKAEADNSTFNCEILAVHLAVPQISRFLEAGQIYANGPPANTLKKLKRYEDSCRQYIDDTKAITLNKKKVALREAVS
ncbi:uncharacterized protein [Palaemon carinicauda]|uniref:uncharacterized protein n=1 Tax=Palaemon carinicauda TaxID=392227 RepID=UPI0035B5EDBA